MLLETTQLFETIREQIPVDCEILITEWRDEHGTMGIKIVLRAKIKNRWREACRIFNYFEIEKARMSSATFQKHLINQFCEEFVEGLKNAN